MNRIVWGFVIVAIVVLIVWVAALIWDAARQIRMDVLSRELKEQERRRRR